MSKHKHILAIIALTAALPLTAQKASPSSLNETKLAVQFEIEQKDALRLMGAKLADTFNILARTQVDDQQIIRTIELNQHLMQLIQKLDDTNARQAILAEQIKKVTSQQDLSPQEGKIYRQCELVLTELAHAQAKLHFQAQQQQKALEGFFRKLPPPPTLTLENGLKFTLVKTPEATFYASQMIPDGMALALTHIATNPKLKVVTPTFFQARELLEILRRQTLLPLAMPNRIQMTAMMKRQIQVPCAAWCAEQFSTKRRLATRANTDFEDHSPKRQPLTPAQNNAAARFKIKFATVWDPKHLIDPGQYDFLREIPQAHYQKLSMFVVAPVHIGSSKRLAELTRKLNDRKNDGGIMNTQK